MKLKTSFAALMLFVCALAGAEQPFPMAEIESARDDIHNGAYSAAISRLEHMETATASWEQHFWLGTAYLLDGQLVNAADALDRALGLQGERASIWVQRAVVEHEQGRYPVALQFLEIASEVDRDYALTYLNAGQVYESLGKWDNARGAYGEFLKLSMRADGSARMLRLRREILQRIANTADTSS